jgi:hypothetical protein
MRVSWLWFTGSQTWFFKILELLCNVSLLTPSSVNTHTHTHTWTHTLARAHLCPCYHLHISQISTPQFTVHCTLYTVRRVVIPSLSTVNSGQINTYVFICHVC